MLLKRAGARARESTFETLEFGDVHEGAKERQRRRSGEEPARV